MSLDALPNELLSECFAHISADKPSINSLRLVSKRLHIVSSHFLITKILVRFTQRSVNDLERVAAHHFFSKSVQSININVSFYDKLLAESLEVFYGTLEARGVARPAIDPVGGLGSEWRKWYEEYVEMYQDQESVVKGNRWLERVVASLKSFTALKTIVIDDRAMKPVSLKTGMADAQTRSMVNTRYKCIATSRWNASFTTAVSAGTPFNVVSDLFSGLAINDIRPSAFEFNIATPRDLRCLRLTDVQLAAVAKCLSKAERLYMSIGRWMRTSPQAVDHERPRDEMEALCAFTKAFFTSERLVELHLSLDDYPITRTAPNVSLYDFTTLPFRYPRLSRIYFRNVPFTLADIGDFVEGVKETLKWLILRYPYLLTGTWKQGLDTLRRLKRLSYAEIEGLRGCEAQEWLIEEGEASGFVLGLHEWNPFETED